MKAIRLTLAVLLTVSVVQSALAATAVPEITSRDTTIMVNGTEWTHTITDGMPFFKVNYDDESIYLDRSFTLCWPTKLGKYSLDGLQSVLIDKLSNIRLPYQEEREPLKTYDEAIESYSSTGDNSLTNVERVVSIPNDPESEEMYFFNRTNMSLEITAPRFVAYSFVQDAFFGGVANHIVKFVNYDLKSDCVLTIDDVIKPGAEAVVVDKLKEMEIWEELWDEFREKPYVCHNFLLCDDKLVLIYNRYEITYGSMGNVTLVFPYEQIKPYLKRIVKELFK